MKTIRIIDRGTDLMIFKFEDDGSVGSIPQTGDTVVAYEGKYKVVDREHILSTDHPYGPGELNIYVMAESEALPEPNKEELIELSNHLSVRATGILAAYLKEQHGVHEFTTKFTKKQIMDVNVYDIKGVKNFGIKSQKELKAFIAFLANNY